MHKFYFSVTLVKPAFDLINLFLNQYHFCEHSEIWENSYHYISLYSYDF